MEFHPDTAHTPWPRPQPPELDFSKAIAQAREAFAFAENFAAQNQIEQALVWAERAHRLAPMDPNIEVALAGACLSSGNTAGALTLFQSLTARFDLPELWLGLAQSQHLRKAPKAAANSMARLISRNLITSEFAPFATHLAKAAGFAGFCGVGNDLCLITNIPLEVLTVSQAGKSLRPRKGVIGAIDLKAGPLTVVLTQSASPLLGSPLDPAAMLRLEGIARRNGKKIEGWAWFPGAATLDPVLDFRDKSGAILRTETPHTMLGETSSISPLLRARKFSVTLSGPDIAITGPTGQRLLGTPLPAIIEKRASRGKPNPHKPATVTIIIPVYSGLRETRACIASVLLNKPPAYEVIVVDDAIPDPALRAYIEEQAAREKIRLIPSDPVHHRNLGFVGAVNAGLAAAGANDVVLLNADTIMPPHGLATMRQAAYCAPNIGTVTPISNEATILSYPRPSFDPRPFKNLMPNAAQTAELSALAAKANPGIYVEIPTAHGFCMFIRADCLAAVGNFRADLFAQGYGEENDFCERARTAGFIHIALPSVFVAHAGNVSFGTARDHLLTRNLEIIDQLYPTYRARIEEFIAADPLHPARARIDRARFIAGRKKAGAVLLITHGGGGGTTRVINERIADIESQGLRVIILRPRDGFCTIADGNTEFYDLGAPLPAGRAELLTLLRGENLRWAEIHHVLDHHPEVLALPRDLQVAYDVIVHDWAFICARMSFLDGEGRFCGEPGIAACAACVDKYGATISEDIAPAALLARSAQIFAAARAVIVPHEDGGTRLRRYFPKIAVTVRHWQEDGALAMLQIPANPHPVSASHPATIVVIGGIGIEKGFNRLLACAQDAAARDLPLRFAVAGYTVDDPALFATGRVFVSGEFQAAEAKSLITKFAGDLAFLPSVWPETWCYALTDAWEAGLSSIVFDIGAQAARVRATGRGQVLPLALPPAKINDFLIKEAQKGRALP